MRQRETLLTTRRCFIPNIILCDVQIRGIKYTNIIEILKNVAELLWEIVHRRRITVAARGRWKKREEETSKDWFLDRKLVQQSGATEGKVNEANYVYETRVYSSFVLPWWVWLSSLLVISAGKENTIRLIPLKSYKGAVRAIQKRSRLPSHLFRLI